jgi:hypothetical protein
MSSEPGIVDIALWMVACVAIRAGLSLDVGSVACRTAYLALVEGDLNMVVHEVLGVGHLQAVACIAELLL